MSSVNTVDFEVIGLYALLMVAVGLYVVPGEHSESGHAIPFARYNAAHPPRLN